MFPPKTTKNGVAGWTKWTDGDVVDDSGIGALLFYLLQSALFFEEEEDEKDEEDGE